MTKILWLFLPLTIFGIFLTVDHLLFNEEYARLIWNALHPTFAENSPAMPILHKNFSQIISL